MKIQKVSTVLLSSLRRVSVPKIIFLAFSFVAVFYFGFISAVPPASAAITVLVEAIGTQIGTANIPSGAQYVGGAFKISASGPTSITKIVVTVEGTVATESLSGFHIHYDLSATGDCASESFSESDPTYGFATDFPFGARQGVFTGNVAISSTTALCVYPVLDIGSGAVNGSTIEMAINEAYINVVASGDATVCPVINDQRLCDYVPVIGTTVLVLPPPPVVTVAETGNQKSLLTVPGASQYVGGAFRMHPDAGSTSIERVTITQNGSVNSGFLSSARLRYDVDSTAPYDCESESYSESDLTYGLTTSFGFLNTAVFQGSLGIDTTHAACFYVVLDTLRGITNNQTLEIEITNPSVDVIVSGNATVSPVAPVRLRGTTLLSAPVPSVVVVDTIRTQAPFLTIPSTAQHVGGVFRMKLETGSTSITAITLTENGTVFGGSLSSIRLYYDADTTSPYDCVSESFDGNEGTLGFPASFQQSWINTARYEGSVALNPSRTLCFYVVLDVRADAINGQTLELEISNPEIDVVTSGGATVSPATPVRLDGTTTLSIAPPAVVTVDSIGIQTALLSIPSSGQYVGGAFRMTIDSGSSSITRILVTAGGTAGSLAIPQIRLHYDIDTSLPYDCQSESYAVSDIRYGAVASFGGFYGTTATFTDLVSITPTRALCFYVVLDVGGDAVNGSTIEIQMPIPATEIIASGGVAVSPSQTVDIVGTTVLSTTTSPSEPTPQPQPSPEPGLKDGDLVRLKGDVDVWIIKFVGDKKFKRLILNPFIFDSYGHLSWSNIKEVSDISQYTTSTIVRELNDTRVYQLFPSGDTGLKRHLDISAAQFEAAGRDWDSIYIINQLERDFYETDLPLLT